MYLDKFLLDKIQNGRLSAIIHFQLPVGEKYQVTEIYFDV